MRVSVLLAAALFVAASLLGAGPSSPTLASGAPDGDSQVPPIDVPAFGRPWFVEVTNQAGLADFLHAGWMGPGNLFDPPAYFIETMGPGACWIDYDLDGWLDLYLINGLYHTHAEKNAIHDPHSQLRRNNGNGTFTDVTTTSGTRLVGDYQACAAADYDEDGDQDLMVVGWEDASLFQNNGDGTFTDVAAAAGVIDQPCGAFLCWATHVSWFDADRDGCLDLYISHFDEIDPLDPPPDRNNPGPGQRNRFYQSDCDGTFTDRTKAVGLYFEKSNTWSSVAADLDLDGDLDIYTSNDGDENDVYLNLGDGTFRRKNESHALDPYSGMGTSVADVDHDGYPELVTTNWHGTYNGVYFSQDGDWVNRGHEEPFSDAFDVSGWAAQWYDFNHDTHLDLMIYNGATEALGVFPVDQPILAYDNLDGTWMRSRTLMGDDLQGAWAGRGGGWADYDNDGDIDFHLTEAGENPTNLFRADMVGGNFLNVDIVGTGPTMTREAVGTKVYVHAPGLPALYHEKILGTGYQSGNDPRLHFGLGDHRVVDLEVKWLDGSVEWFTDVRTNSFVRIVQGQGLGVLQEFPLFSIAAPGGPLARATDLAFSLDLAPDTVPAGDVVWTLPDGREVLGSSIEVQLFDVGWQAIKATVVDAEGRAKTQGLRILVTDDLHATVVFDRTHVLPTEEVLGRVVLRYSNGDPVIGAPVALHVTHDPSGLAVGTMVAAAPERVGLPTAAPRVVEGTTDASGNYVFRLPFSDNATWEDWRVEYHRLGSYEAQPLGSVRGIEYVSHPEHYFVTLVPPL